MNKLTLLSAFISVTIQLSGQDMFPAKQLTFDPAQQGFATWSPDSKYIVYQYTDLNDTLGKNGLWKVSADSTEARQIFTGIAEHAKWSPDGRHIVFDADTGNSIRMIPAAGGDVIKFLPDSVLIQNGGLPCWSPDGSQIAFLERKRLSLSTFNLKTGELKSLFSEEGKLPLPGGWWVDGKSILVANMDRQTRKCTMLKVFAENGEIIPVTGHNENFYRHIALSPDGSLLIYAVLEGKYLGLYIMPSEGGRSLPLAVTKDGHTEGAAWSPDGKKIAFTRTQGRNFDIWVMEVNVRKIKEILNNG
jgi:dipeptidyl aminopeptidase/acylaminoacyl peptidase